MDKPTRELRRSVRSLQVRFWFEGLKTNLGAKSTHALALQVEPELTWQNAETEQQTWTNKWRAFKKGARNPRRALLAKADRLVSHTYDSLGDFDHVLWEVLQTRRPTSRQITDWLNRLNPLLRKIAAKGKRPAGIQSTQWLVDFVNRDFIRIRQIPSLDALALLTLVIHQAHRTGMNRIAISTGHAVCSMVLQLARRFRTPDLAADVLLHYEKWVLPLTAFRDQRLSFGNDPLHTLELLRRFVEIVDSRIRPLKNELDVDRQIRKVLSGRYGLNRRQVFMPVLVPIDEAS